jgi:hypothetical protein
MPMQRAQARMDKVEWLNGGTATPLLHRVV